MNHRYTTDKFFLIAVCILALCSVVQSSSADSLSFESTIIHTASNQRLNAQFAFLTVPENRARLTGKTVRIAVWKFPCTGAQPAPWPIAFVPDARRGDSIEAINTLPGWLETITALRQQADVILFDPRGSGRSEP